VRAPVKPAPGIPVPRPVCLPPPCAWRNAKPSRTVSGSAAPPALPRARSLALPQGPSLRSGLCCPRPSSLTRPHPPHSPTPHDFAAPRLIRAALPRRERLGRPRVVPCFRCPFRPDMSPSSTPGSPPAACAQFLRRRHWPSPVSERLGTPKYPTIRFPWGLLFRGCPGSLRYDLSACSPPWTDPTELTLGRRRLVRPGFHRVGHPSRCRV
jgi:hypothetical protein